MNSAPSPRGDSPTRIEAAPEPGASTPPADLSELLGRQVGNYVLERPLAQGGMARVFVARHPHLGREVAVKFLNPELHGDGDLDQRFLQEARVMAGLRHPNIVEIYDFGKLDDRSYYTMELLKGTDLESLIGRKRFTPDEAVRYLQQICAALDAAHQVGVVHRDLKPANVFVLDEHAPHLKLMDFGIAKIKQPGKTGTLHGQILGTPTHMAPEQALGQIERITPRTDLYSAGVIAYELLVGELPFTHNSDFALMMMHVRDPVPPIRTRAPEIPKRLATIVEQCLAKDPEKRPASARALADQLAQVLRPRGRSEPSPKAPPANGPPPLVDPPKRKSRAPRAPGTLVRAQAPQSAKDDAPKSRVTPSKPAPPNAGAAPAPKSAEAKDGKLGAKMEAKAKAPEVKPGEPKILEAKDAKVGAELRDVLLPKLSPEERASPRISMQLKAVAIGIPSLEDETEGLDTLPNAHIAEALRAVEPDPNAEPPALLSELMDDPAAAGATVALSAGDGKVLDKLLRRMQRNADFPAFLNNVTEISLKADADNSYSPNQLGESILKDFALTAKLLRMANTLFASRFGGKVFSVKQAVVILGFDSVRSIALGVSVFKLPGQKAATPKAEKPPPNPFQDQLAEASVSSLVSGEIARVLAVRTGLRDSELAMTCAMFRNLGQHLAMEYLPDDYGQIQRLCGEGASFTAACARVLGTSTQKLGLGVAERWNLPQRVQSALAYNPLPTDKLERDEQKLAALGKFANDLCYIITTGERHTWDKSIAVLLERNQNLLALDDKEITALLGTVCKSFEERYSALFGPYSRKSRFLRNARSMTDGDQPTNNSIPPPTEEDLAKLHAATDALTRSVNERRDPKATLNEALQVLSEALVAPRLVLLVLASDRQSLVVGAALGEDALALSKHLRLPVTHKQDVFWNAQRSGKGAIITDALAPNNMRRVPQPYYEALGSPAFAIYPCTCRGYSTALLLADADFAHRLPPADRVSATAPLRELCAKLAERLSSMG